MASCVSRISEQDYINLVESIFGDQAQTVVNRYPVDEENTATDRARFLMKMSLRMYGRLLDLGTAL